MSIGCIFAEMAQGNPLFPRDSETNQLFRVFRLEIRNSFFYLHVWVFRTLGSLDEKIWPGCTRLPDYKKNFLKWAPESLLKIIPGMNRDGLNLLHVRGDN